MIDELNKLPKENNYETLIKILSNIHQQATGVIYTDTEPTAVPHGKVVIYDNGSGTKRLYLKTGKGNIGYVNLT